MKLWINGLVEGRYRELGENIKGLVSEDDVPAEDGTSERGRDSEKKSSLDGFYTLHTLMETLI